ncbi:MAG TPA: CoA-acylating methylmalonate-semialdehyde dehydrogenase [Kofleriaceae bacterium]|nr:CoA-acylating methylmalonate-semialdehyde dehydrogenase [Kofleriaceae bacterium]
MVDTLRNYIGGQWLEASSARALDVENPATGEILARVPLSSRDDLDRAVTVAREAFQTWRRVPPVQRARYLFKFRALLEKHAEELARIVTQEHGKTLDESRGDVRRGIENVEHACGIPTLMMGDTVEDVAAGIDCETIRQPLGVFAAVTPFNFPAMVPLWFWPYAVATGNAYIVKPSEQVPLAQQRMFELAHDAGLPAGVLNLVHGDKDVVEGILEHPGIAGVSFVGSTPVAQLVYKRAAKHGKRVQALGGAKNHLLVMPDAELDKTVATLVESCFGCAGQRCLAGSVVVAVGEVYEQLRDRLVETAKQLVVGNGLEPGVTLGPVVSGRQKDRILSAIEAGIKEGGKLLLDGRKVEVPGYPRGHFLGATIFDGVTPDMSLAREEIFGPVMVLRRAKNLDEAIAMIHASEYANATSIFTQSGKAAREFRYRAGVSMMGVNIGVAAPMAFFPFGGTKSSFFGDTKAHGKDSINFFTDQKVVISRWF